MSAVTLRIGYIPLVDATALLVAVDMGFAAAEKGFSVMNAPRKPLVVHEFGWACGILYGNDRRGISASILGV